MEVRINKTFLKELSRIPAKQRIRVEHFVFNEAANFNNPCDIPNVKKLIGYKSYYRIRFGEYRAGIRIEDGVMVFERMLHRKDIYKFFP